MRSSFLDYAMSVIVSRALPDVRDGLKPVHRRVLYGMHEAGLQPNRPYKKSASTVGAVMANYHPHGDSAIYDTLVRMAQPFSLRYPLVDGQGNFGSIDDDPAAAMRYTEARLSRLATELLRDIDANTVDFEPNYDESRRQPSVLPSRFPNLLVNGSTGIAVGMATNMPPHHLGETIDAVIAMIDDAGDLRRGPDEAHQGPRLPDRRDHRGAQRDPRRVPHRPRPRRHARARPYRGAARRPFCHRRHRAAVRREEGRRHRRHRQDRRPRPRQGAHRGLGPRRPLRPHRHADPDRAQARRHPAGRAQQALQAHAAAVDVRLQRRRARRRRPAHALAARARPALPRVPARGRHPPLEGRAAQGRGPRARPRGLPHRARQHRRDRRADPRRGRPDEARDAADGAVRALARSRRRRSSTSGSRAPHRSRAQGGRERVQGPQERIAELRADPRRPGEDRRRHPRGAARDQADLRAQRRPPHRDRRRRGGARARGPDRRGGHGHRDHAVGLHQAATGDDLPRAAARRHRRDGDGAQGGRLHRAPLRRLDARLHPLLHERRQGLPAQGARAAARLAPVEGPRDRQPPARSVRRSRCAP